LEGRGRKVALRDKHAQIKSRAIWRGQNKRPVPMSPIDGRREGGKGRVEIDRQLEQNLYSTGDSLPRGRKEKRKDSNKILDPKRGTEKGKEKL